MQSYKTSQVGGRASQVGGITCKEKNYRTVRDGGNLSVCIYIYIYTHIVEVQNITSIEI